MEDQAVRWNIKVSKETDLTLRTFLGAQGAKKGDLSIGGAAVVQEEQAVTQAPKRGRSKFVALRRALADAIEIQAGRGYRASAAP
jgi:hypothetical protein